MPLLSRPDPGMRVRQPSQSAAFCTVHWFTLVIASAERRCAASGLLLCMDLQNALYFSGWGRTKTDCRLHMCQTRGSQQSAVIPSCKTCTNWYSLVWTIQQKDLPHHCPLSSGVAWQEQDGQQQSC